jgi:hypothetical protein
VPRDFRIQRFIEARARSAYVEIGVAGEHPDALAELVDCRLVDELDSEAQRDAKRDRQHGERMRTRFCASEPRKIAPAAAPKVGSETTFRIDAAIPQTTIQENRL